MASTITLDRPELPTKEEGANGVQDGVGVQGSATKGGSEDIAATGTDGQTTDSISPSPSPGSGSVSLRGTTLNGTSPGPSNAPPLTVPQPKKFSHVNINKKFLEKTSSASSSGPSTSTLVSAKVGSMPRAWLTNNPLSTLVHVLSYSRETYPSNSPVTLTSGNS